MFIKLINDNNSENNNVRDFMKHYSLFLQQLLVNIFNSFKY